jgi:Tfp pilus assembly protein PilF
MMPDPKPSAATLRGGLLAILMLTAGCSTTKPSGEEAPTAQQATAPRGESEALMTARNALNAGDCRAASEAYVAAAGFSEDPQVAMAASQLALTCNNFKSAAAATERWRELQPFSGDAALAAALVAMKQYDIDAAREALTAFRDSGSAGNQDPLTFAEALQEETDAALLHRLFAEVLVGEDPAAEVLLAQARLAMAAQDMQATIDAAEQASALASEMIEPQVMVLRALSVLGEHNAALAGARALPAEALEGEDAFLVADLLAAAGSSADAEAELTRLAAAPETAPGAERRLITMAFRNGQLDLAQERLQAMVAQRGNSALAVLYLAQLAERRGDDSTAIQSYGLLAETPLELNARSAAARLLMKQGASAEALRLLDDYAAQNPDEALQAGLTRVHLLSDGGDLAAATQTLDELAKAFPDHPDISYTRATVLESNGRTRQAIAEFERALQRRPEDPQLLNALGYTLADHKQQLGKAEAHIRKALQWSPDNPAIQDSLGWLLFRRGKTADALKVLERAWDNSGDGEIGAHFGEVLWHAGDQNRARYVWQQALNGDPDHKGLRDTMARLTGEDAQ